MGRQRKTKTEVQIPVSARVRGRKRRRSSALQYGFDPSLSPCRPDLASSTGGDGQDSNENGIGKDQGGPVKDNEEDSAGSPPPPTTPNRLSNLRRRAQGPIEARPGRCRGFHISRIIEHTDKSGNFVDPPRYARLNNPNFDYSVGDFVLNLSAKKSNRCRVRNYAGQQGNMPRRMLQDVFQPWCIPTNILLDDDNGVPFPLRFLTRDRTERQGDGTAFVEDEAVMVARDSQNERYSEVLDFEREPGTVRKTHLCEDYDVPWDLLVDQDALEARFSLRGTKKPRRSEAVIGTVAAAATAAMLVPRPRGKFRVVHRSSPAAEEDKIKAEPEALVT